MNLPDDTKPDAKSAGKKLPDTGWVIATTELWLESFGGAIRAHNPGDPVPVDNVKQYGWENYVRPAEDGEIPPSLLV
jgi:hypothetical protein